MWRVVVAIAVDSSAESSEGSPGRSAQYPSLCIQRQESEKLGGKVRLQHLGRRRDLDDVQIPSATRDDRLALGESILKCTLRVELITICVPWASLPRYAHLKNRPGTWNRRHTRATTSTNKP